MRVRVTYDLFVSFAEADREWVAGYLLPELGVEAGRVITQDDFRPGAALMDEFTRAVDASRYSILVLSPSFLADRWTAFGEQLASFTGVEEGRARVVPVLLRPVELPTRLRYLVRLDCTTKERWPAEVARIRALLDRAEPAPEPAIPCPYPGMVAFEPADATRFHGREALVATTLDRLAAQPFLAFIGASGSGKSSVINAGILPGLERDPRFPRPVRVVRIRPGAFPIAHLADALAAATGGDAEEIADRLGRDGATLRPELEAIGRTGAALELGVLVVDQFEEIFAQCKDTAVRARFLGLVDGLLRDVPGGWRVLLAIRNDFFPEAMASPVWDRLRTALVELQPLQAQELRRAISVPARDVGVYLEAALVDRLIEDAEDEKGALPLLQQTLVVMWSRFMARRLLSLSDYESLGSGGRTGLQEALRIWADATLSQLSQPGREDVARRILVRLIEFGEGRRDTARQQPRDALLDGPEATEASAVLEVLVNRRLVTTDVEQGTNRVLVDLAHETLIEAWPRLQEWVVAYEQVESERRQLVLAATAWKEHGSDDSYALTGRRLVNAEAWATRWPDEVGAREREFLGASRRVDGAIRRRRRVTVLLAAGLAAVFVVAGGAVARREIVRASTGSNLVFFAAGLAVIGSDNGGIDHRVFVNAFSLEVHEVSNAQYRACVADGPCGAPADRSRFDAPGGDLLPVTSINPPQAQAFCAWLGRRLPTSTEWERAARGTGGRAWPWVREIPTDLPELSHLQGVETGEETRSPERIYDLVGNVDEFVTGSRAGTFWVAGGSYARWPASITDLLGVTAIASDDAYGFRCATGGG